MREARCFAFVLLGEELQSEANASQLSIEIADGLEKNNLFAPQTNMA